MTTQSTKIVLILGANGRLGQAAADAFADAGWSVLAQSRKPLTAPRAGVQQIALDMADTESVVAAATGASTVVYAVNPLYTAWDKELMPLANQGIDIAQRLGALFMLPGNVYAFGENMPLLLRETTPQQPTTEKGYQRRHLEYVMQRRALKGLRSVVIRAGDFFGAGTGNWFDQAIVKSLASGKLVYPGPLNQPHAWAYLPDLAHAFVGVAERELDDKLNPATPAEGAQTDQPAGAFRTLHFGGHTFTGSDLLKHIEQAARELGIAPARGFRHAGLPWTLIRVVGIVMPMWRELARMSYLWRVAHRLDGRALNNLLPDLPHTPADRAIRDSLLALGLAKSAATPSATSPATSQNGATLKSIHHAV
jgi:nucleoside-diphosphate-sugar epimerase